MQTISVETRQGRSSWVANGIGAAMQIKHPDACEAVLALDENTALVSRSTDPEVAVGRCIEQAVSDPLSGLTLSPELIGLPAKALGHLAFHDGMPGIKVVSKGRDSE